MPRYAVCWTIDVNEAASPLEAVEMAWKFLRAPGSKANHIRVTDPAGTIDTVNLLEAYGADGRPEDLADCAPKLRDFAVLVANMTIDGEVMNDEIFEMDADDAIETIGNLIATARNLVKTPDGKICDHCGRLAVEHELCGLDWACTMEERECTCSSRSWYGDVHDSACDFAGEARQ